MHNSHPRRLVRVVALGAAAALGWGAIVTAPTAAVAAEPAATSPLPTTVTNDSLPTWQINGVVWSQVVVGNTVYVTGSFSKARPPGVAAGGAGEIAAKNIFAFDIRTGNPVPNFSHSLNAQGMVVRASEDGSRVYVGGDFTTVDGVARGHLAAFNTSDGSLVTSFAPNIDNQVRALVQTGTTLYAGGNFYSAVGKPRHQLAAFDTTNGKLLNWAPPTGDTGFVWSMVLAPDKSRVIVGGSFSTLNGDTAVGMGSLDAATGATLPWAANQKIVTAGSNGAITSLSTDGTQIFGSGFAYGDGARFEGTFAADPSTGSINWVNDCLGDTYDTFPVGQTLYSVGHTHDCSVVNSFPDTSPRTRWQPAQAQPTFPVGTIDRTDAYGWNFVGLPYAGLLHWWPSLSFGNYTSSTQAAWSVTGNDTYIVLGGEFPKVNGVAQQGLARYAKRPVAPDTQKPIYAPASTPTPTPAANGVQVVFTAMWDRDDETLYYDIYRNSGAAIATLSAKSNFWTLPVLSFLDTKAAPGSSVKYEIRARDAKGNVQWSAWSTTITVPDSIGTSSYSSAVKASQPTNYWTMDDPSSDYLFDSVGNLTLATGSTLTAGVTGAIDGFNAVATSTSSYGSTVLPSEVGSSTSVEAWVKTTSNSGGRIVGYGDAATGAAASNRTDRALYLDNSGRVNFNVYSDGYHAVTSRQTVNDGAWHHLVGTVGADGMQLYIDGARAGRDQRYTAAQTPHWPGYWRIGWDQINNFPNRPSSMALAGAIDEVAVYDRAMPMTEVQSHYTASGRSQNWSVGTSDYATTLLADQPDLYWDLGSDGSVPDQAGSGEYGNPMGGITWSQPGAIAGNSAATFNGSDSLIVSQHAWNAPGPYTAELWFQTTTNRGGKLFSFGNATSGLSSQYDRHVVMRNDGRLEYGVYPGTTKTVTSDNPYNDGNWHLASATLGEDGMKLYVDGLLVGSDPSVTYGEGYWGMWRLGGDNTWGNTSSNYIAATLDEFVVYPKVLSEDTIRTHFAASGRSAAARPPVASFTATTSFLTAKVDGSASSDPDGDLTTYAWDFGDGTTAADATAEHTYAEPGTYQVTLTVTDSTDKTASTTQQVTVVANQAPTAAFDATMNSLGLAVDASASADVDGTIESYAWDFGDGATGTGVTASHVYAAAGTYTVSLTVTDDAGATNTVTRSVEAVKAPNQAPTAKFVADVANLKVSLDASDTADPDGTIESYAWDFGDGTTDAGVTNVHTYAAAGTYTITLTVTDNEGATDSVSTPLNVIAANVKPTAAFTSTAKDAEVTFDASGSTDTDGTLDSYAWEFGDGTTGTGDSPKHTYGDSGTYKVKLTVTDDRGGKDSVSHDVTVTLPGPVAKDDFGRSATGGWGSADAGGKWTLSGGASKFSVADGVGKVALGVGNGYTASLASVSAQDVDVTTKLAIDKVATGGGQYAAVIARQVSGADYRIKLRVNATGDLTAYLMRTQGTTESALKTVTVTGIANATDSALRVRFQVTGTNPTTVRAKVWKAGASEPSGWTLSATDSTAALQAAGGVGLYSYLSGSATNAPVVFAWDEFLVK